MVQKPSIGGMSPGGLLVTIFVVATLTWLFWKGVFAMFAAALT